MKKSVVPSYGYDILTAPLPFGVETQDVLPSNTKKKNNKVNMKKAGKARNLGNIGVPALIVKTYKLPSGRLKTSPTGVGGRSRT